MHRTIHRLAGAGALSLLLAAAVGAGSAVAAPAPGTAPGGARSLGAASGRCAAAWEAARERPTVANLQAVGRCEIDRRLDTLANLQKAVAASKTLTDAHEAALDGILVSTTSGLTALRAKIDADTTVAALREDVRRIFEDFRVYVLVARQVGLVMADDVVAAGVERVETAADRLDDAIEAARASVREARESLRTAVREARAGFRDVR